MASSSPERENPPDDPQTPGSNGSDTSASDTDSDCEVMVKEPCKYYNRGSCRDGDACRYWHVCKFALSGNCRYGSKCKLKHPGGGRGARNRGGGGGGGGGEGESPRDLKLTDGRLYQWQLSDGGVWADVENDHVIEAQFCLPHSKGMKIYNTEHGDVYIDFSSLRVRVNRGKRLRVRRLEDGHSEWVWYCTLQRKWTKYGEKDADGNPGQVKSSDIERKFQMDPSGSFTFNIGANTFEIKFAEMRQVSSGRKRNVARRPIYRQGPQGAGAAQGAATGHHNMPAGSKAQWQFQGDSGSWQNFMNPADIEKTYQQNHRGTMVLTAIGNTYDLDFGAMTQTNRKTKRTRKIRRN